MKKIFLFIFILALSITLSGCNNDLFPLDEITSEKVLTHGEIITQNTEIRRRSHKHLGYFPAVVCIEQGRLIVLWSHDLRTTERAIIIFNQLGYYGGVFTYRQIKAFNIARNAHEFNAEPILEINKGKEYNTLHFWHYHAYERLPKGHAWFFGPPSN